MSPSLIRASTEMNRKYVEFRFIEALLQRYSHIQKYLARYDCGVYDPLIIILAGSVVV
jgi:hypothetical protein